MLLLAAALFFAEPAPMEMPRAEAYRVTADGVVRLEDRFNRFDLWVAQCVVGRWTDDDGRVFTLAALDAEPPLSGAEDATVTRVDHYSSQVRIPQKDLSRVRQAIAALTGLELPEKPRRPHQLPRAYDDLDYWEGTNENLLVAAYLPRHTNVWQVAVWELLAEDDREVLRATFEDEFLGRQLSSLKPDVGPRTAGLSERELLRHDARQAIAAYGSWHVTDADEFTVLDNLPDRDFVDALTNDFRMLRADCVRVMPTPICGSNVLAVARLYRSRDEYVDALGLNGDTNLVWSAAYWSAQRRELVAYMPEGGVCELLKTIRHEAFHQYYSYATAMMPTSPWLNEGYAQFFEGEAFAERWTPEQLEEYAKFLPTLLTMDYAAFYDGTAETRALKYKLAFSLAEFIEKGAPKVRFEPFKTLKRDYTAVLFETMDPVKATGAAFGNRENFELFVREWKRYLLNM